VLIIISISSAFGGKCPDADVIKPCWCEDNYRPGKIIISCGGQYFDIKQMFTRLNQALNQSEKHFDIFWFHNRAIEVIPENVFGDITFDEVAFYQAENLTKIHTFALGKSAKTITNFHLGFELPSLQNDLPDYDLFKMMSLMVNVKKIDAFDCEYYGSADRQIGPKVSSIPEYAFRPLNGEQNDLTRLGLAKEYIGGGGTLSTISNYAFYYLNNLNYIGLYRSNINHIPAHAFDFKKSSNVTLELNLGSNNLNGSSFEVGAFMNAQRPINLNLMYNKMQYIDEIIFGSFLSLNPENKIHITGNILSCSDCRSYWLVRDRDKFKNQIVGEVECRDKKSGNIKSFWEANDFADCKSK
jgi:hypothetical protein